MSRFPGICPQIRPRDGPASDPPHPAGPGRRGWNGMEGETPGMASWAAGNDILPSGTPSGPRERLLLPGNGLQSPGDKLQPPGMTSYPREQNLALGTGSSPWEWAPASRE